MRLLREIAPHFRELEVMDEGGYWESGDLNVLIQKMAFLRDAIEGLADRLLEG